MKYLYTLIGIIAALILFYKFGISDDSKNRAACMALFTSTIESGDPKDLEDLKKELKETSNQTIEERIRENCKRWVKNGQKFN